MDIDLDTMRTMQIYAYIVGTVILVFILYGYIYYLYSSEKKGQKDYEKYSNIALDDSIDSNPIQNSTIKEKEKWSK